MAEKNPKRGLGSGLDALFGPAIEPADDENKIQFLPISKVEPRPGQPRYSFDDEALAELAESIRQYGLIQPITVRALGAGYYQIIAGERRWRASRLAGLTEVPVRVIEADDKKATELALVENLQREDLNPVEEAKGYRTLMDEFGMTQEEAAAAVGKSRPAVANMLRLLSLDESVQAMVEDGTLSAGHARTLIPLRDKEAQREVAGVVAGKHLSVRQTEQLVARLLDRAARAKQLRDEGPKDDFLVNYTRAVEHELEDALGRKVKLVDSKKRGRIELEFYGADDREALINNLILLGTLRQKKP